MFFVKIRYRIYLCFVVNKKDIHNLSHFKLLGPHPGKFFNVYKYLGKRTALLDYKAGDRTLYISGYPSKSYYIYKGILKNTYNIEISNKGCMMYKAERYFDNGYYITLYNKIIEEYKHDVFEQASAQAKLVLNVKADRLSDEMHNSFKVLMKQGKYSKTAIPVLLKFINSKNKEIKNISREAVIRIAGKKTLQRAISQPKIIEDFYLKYLTTNDIIVKGKEQMKH